MVTEVDLPAAVVERTHAHLQATGLLGLEGIVLWTGEQDGAAFRVREVLVPEQDGTRNDRGLMVTVHGPELQRINMQLWRTGQRLLAQVHSHPGRAYHSAMDDERAIVTSLGGFSVVVPDFAREPISMEQCAVYRLMPSKWWQAGSRPRWAAVPSRSVDAMFNILEG